MTIVSIAAITAIIWLFAYLAAKSLTMWGLVVLSWSIAVVVALALTAVGMDDDTIALTLAVVATMPLWASAIAWLHGGGDSDTK